MTIHSRLYAGPSHQLKLNPVLREEDPVTVVTEEKPNGSVWRTVSYGDGYESFFCIRRTSGCSDEEWARLLHVNSEAGCVAQVRYRHPDTWWPHPRDIVVMRRLNGARVGRVLDANARAGYAHVRLMTSGIIQAGSISDVRVILIADIMPEGLPAAEAAHWYPKEGA